MSKNRYIDLAKQLKELADNAPDIEVDEICDELDELWDAFSDDDKDYLNGLDNDD
jgi:uncharacterized protein (DUF736 family)